MRSRPSAETGPAIRKLRLARGWTLADLSEHSGVPISTLSRVELGQTLLNYDKLVRLCRALDVDLQGLIAHEAAVTQAPSGRRSIVRAGEGAPVRVGGLNGRAAASDLLAKSFSPILLDLQADEVIDTRPLASMDAELYLLVLDGEVILRSALYAPVTLKAGDAIYFDGRSGHALGATAGARALLVVEGEFEPTTRS
jgi:transcriptional regulator with XRE-family HTH domain